MRALKLPFVNRFGYRCRCVGSGAKMDVDGGGWGMAGQQTDRQLTISNVGAMIIYRRGYPLFERDGRVA